MLTLLTGATFKLSTGSLFGYVCGVFAKQVTNKLIWYVGIGGTMLATLVWVEWIKVQWNVILEDLQHMFLRVKEKE